MYHFLPITDVYAREILDSRGNPTLEVEVLAAENIIGRASVPSGASTGSFEAKELRDGDERYNGKGVKRAADHVNARIAREIVGESVFDQRGIDQLLISLDKTPDKSNLGANAILGVSLAVAHAAANALAIPLYVYLGGIHVRQMPVPMMNILNGGVHAKNNLDFQEFMIMPVSACCFKEALRMGTEVYHSLKEVLSSKNLSTAVGDEGGFAPDIKDAYEALELLQEAVKKAGYEPGKDICYALDAAASELYDKENKAYYFSGESASQWEENKEEGHRKQIVRSTEEMIEYYRGIVDRYPVISIEDPLDEEDWSGWKKLTKELGDRIQIVGDDLFVTNVNRLEKGIRMGCGNSILIKVNQIGTLTESIEAVKMAKENGYTAIISHRSGETEDTTIADLAVALETGQIKTGAPCRGERVAKYNRLLRIEDRLGESTRYSDFR